MSRSSPGVRRVAAILNFIADHPGQAFALTDLVRALKLSRATCHALLTGLVDVGYLFRTSDKTYVLGPSLAAIGRTAAENFSPLQVAQPEMRMLADEYDVVCGAYFLEGDTIHLRERAASHSHVGYPVPLGTRMPLRPVNAIAYFARSPKDCEAWLARTDQPPDDALLAHMEAGMAFLREHGFVVHLRRPGYEVQEEVHSVLTRPTAELPVIAASEIDDAQVYPLVALMAPIYDDKGRVTISLVMAGFHQPMSGAQIVEAGGTLRAACERISRFLAGQPPIAPDAAD
ncbi:transcriptional regulator [Novosphingobium sp. PC22D]|uniref:IclR family transcriptional regulator n=1 Tax=Novosphingobium sp. PC22D TaxID=1962403 RepID=UPI000BEFFB97|nr:helix-turn-helix domain-containing protein [Novosphingobium sp. PC22D]PEQ10398.1 transcriptional regulator [Novosphingobium sp. PC22D]